MAELLGFAPDGGVVSGAGGAGISPAGRLLNWCVQTLEEEGI